MVTRAFLQTFLRLFLSAQGPETGCYSNEPVITFVFLFVSFLSHPVYSACWTWILQKSPLSWFVVTLLKTKNSILSLQAYSFFQLDPCWTYDLFFFSECWRSSSSFWAPLTPSSSGACSHLVLQCYPWVLVLVFYSSCQIFFCARWFKKCWCHFFASVLFCVCLFS